MGLGNGSLVLQEEKFLSKPGANKTLATKERYIYTQPAHPFSPNKLCLIWSFVTLLWNDKETEELQDASDEWHSGLRGPLISQVPAVKGDRFHSFRHGVMHTLAQ